MSNYRDDALDTLILSDKTWLRIRYLADDIYRLSDQTSVFLTVHHVDQIEFSDYLPESGASYNAFDSLQLSDSTSAHRYSTAYALDRLILKDQSGGFYRDESEDTVSFADSTAGILGARHLDNIRFGDSVQGQRYSIHYAEDSFRFADSGAGYRLEQVTDSFLIQDEVSHKLNARSYTVDSITFEDQELSQLVLANHATDSLRFESDTFGHLTAVSRSNDYLVFSDETGKDQASGQAWTANTDTWAMSRYAPYSFDGVTVINEQLYAWNAQGVFRLGPSSELVHGHIQTGKLDFGEVLVHPTAAFLEYQLSGADKQLSIAVTTTQSGEPSSYTYVLPDEDADHLTNGRVFFGRGLRGRHFSFGISLSAQSASINSLSLDFTKTARRI